MHACMHVSPGTSIEGPMRRGTGGCRTTRPLSYHLTRRKATTNLCKVIPRPLGSGPPCLPSSRRAPLSSGPPCLPSSRRAPLWPGALMTPVSSALWDATNGSRHRRWIATSCCTRCEPGECGRWEQFSGGTTLIHGPVAYLYYRCFHFRPLMDSENP